MSANTIEIILGALVAVLGGGRVWEWLVNRRKANADAGQVAMRTAMEAMTQTTDFLKLRVIELSREIEQEREARRKAESQMTYFQEQLSDVQAENKRLREQLGLLNGRRSSDNPSIAALQTELCQLRADNQRQHDEISELRAIIDNLPHGFLPAPKVAE